MADHNLYFVVPATSRTEAEAIVEAMRIAELIGAKAPIEVRHCGSSSTVGHVFASGTVSLRDR